MAILGEPDQAHVGPVRAVDSLLPSEAQNQALGTPESQLFDAAGLQPPTPTRALSRTWNPGLTLWKGLCKCLSAQSL